MNRHARYFVQGLALTAPLGLTLYVVISLALWLDRGVVWLGARLAGKAPDEVSVPFVGVGLLFTLGAVYAIGILGQLWIVNRLVRFGEGVLRRIPLLKTLYGAIKDMLRFVFGDEDTQAGRAVTYEVPGMGIKMMGVITSDHPPRAMAPGNEDCACVYFPMSYQIGGFTFLVPKERLNRLALEGMALMRLAMTAGVDSGAAAAKAGPASRTEAAEEG